jgi:hypothetical protein
MTADRGHGPDGCSTIPINRQYLQLLEQVLIDADSLLRHPLVIHALRCAAGQEREVDVGYLIDAVGLHALRLHQLLAAPPRPHSD